MADAKLRGATVVAATGHQSRAMVHAMQAGNAAMLQGMVMGALHIYAELVDGYRMAKVGLGLPSSNRCWPEGSFESVVNMLLLMEVAKLFWREGTVDRSMLESPLLEALLSSEGSKLAGKAQA